MHKAQSHFEKTARCWLIVRKKLVIGYVHKINSHFTVRLCEIFYEKKTQKSRHKTTHTMKNTKIIRKTILRKILTLV